MTRDEMTTHLENGDTLHNVSGVIGIRWRIIPFDERAIIDARVRPDGENGYTMFYQTYESLADAVSAVYDISPYPLNSVSSWWSATPYRYVQTHKGRGWGWDNASQWGYVNGDGRDNNGVQVTL